MNDFWALNEKEEWWVIQNKEPEGRLTHINQLESVGYEKPLGQF